MYSYERFQGMIKLAAFEQAIYSNQYVLQFMPANLENQSVASSQAKTNA